MSTCQAIRVTGWDWQCLGHVALRARPGVEKRADDVDKLSATSECYLIEVDGKPVAFVGFRLLEIVSQYKYIWVIPFRDLRAKHIRPLRRLMQQHNLGFIIAHVFSGNEKFARLFGFEYHSEIKGMPTYVRRR